MIRPSYFFLLFFSFLLFLLFLTFFSSFFLHFFLSHFFFLSFAITILLCLLDFRLCTQMVQPHQRCQFSITNQKWIRIGIVTILIVIHENGQCSSKVLKVLLLPLCCFVIFSVIMHARDSACHIKYLYRFPQVLSVVRQKKQPNLISVSI